MDYPSAENGIRYDDKGLLLQGWLLLQHQQQGLLKETLIVVQLEDGTELAFPLNQDRDDVIMRVLMQDPYGHPQHHCGFRFSLPTGVDRFTLKAKVGGKKYFLYEVADIGKAMPHKADVVNVFVGKNGWLFLRDDTNSSVKQYQGQLLLSREDIDYWKSYGELLCCMEKEWGLRSAILIAPSKESVLSQYYPYEKVGLRPIDQVLEALSTSLVVYPVKALIGLSDKSYHMNDTHWTDKGAMHASLELCCSFGVNRHELDKIFHNDIYVERECDGDLGLKLDPPRKAMAEMLASYGYRGYVSFDNGLANVGRIMVVESDQALLSSTCLIFGASSAFPMLNFLSRVFACVVVVHSAGNVDKRLIRSVGPDFLVAQTNERYVIRPPLTDYDLKNTIRAKMDGMSEEGMEKLRAQRVDASEEMLERVGLLEWDIGRMESDLDRAV